MRRRFDKRTVFAKQVDDIWTADLVDMSSFPRSNKGYKYLLTVIDVFSKHGWLVPLKIKTGKVVAQAFRKLFLAGHPTRLWTDKGIEFYNQQLKAVLTANNGMLYSTENEEKSSVVERWNRTMKNIMWKLTHSDARNTDARNTANYQHIHNALYATVNTRRATSPKFHVGDKERITRKKGTFERGYTPNWTEEVLTISSVEATRPPTYTINGVVVSMFDFHRSDRGSNPGRGGKIS